LLLHLVIKLSLGLANIRGGNICALILRVSSCSLLNILLKGFKVFVIPSSLDIVVCRKLN